MESEKQSFPDTVAEKLIAQLREGTAPWQKPWQSGEAATRLPFNPATGNRYKGINALHLMSEGHEDQRWLTYKQATALDAQVRKGEKGTAIQFWKFSEEQPKLDASGKPVLDARGEPVKETVQLERPRVFFATVFNAEQIDGLPPLERKAQNWNPVERAEQILQASSATLRHGEHDRAFYRPATDTIHLPAKEQFASADKYYATALHELGHWSGHASRLGRDMMHPFGSEGYAREELRAEIASMIIGDETGIGHDPGQHAAYVESWIKVLRDDPLEIFRAASDAEKIQQYVMGLEQKMVQDEALQYGQQFAERAQQKMAVVALNRMEADMAMPEDGDNEETTALRVEAWVLARLKQRTLPRAMDMASEAQLEKIGGVLSAMMPPNEDNPFWQRHALPTDTADLPLDIAQALEQVVERLSLVDAHSTVNEHEAAARLARINEERVHGDPGSTEEDIAAARELRKNSDIVAVMQDKDMQRRIAAEAEKLQQAQTATETATNRLLIDVPYQQKDEAKALGAKWDRQEQSWFVPAGVDAGLFVKWTAAPKHGAETDTVQASASDADALSAAEVKRQYLAVPYNERTQAKAAGAQWDRAAKSWYAAENTDPARLERWKPDHVAAQQVPAMAPREEFTETLRAVGCIVSGQHPVMDGKKHRISVEGEKFSATAGAGFYVAHLDGHPAGYVKNNKTGEEANWKSKGYALTPEQKALMAAQAADKLQQRETDLAMRQEQAAARVVKQMDKLTPVSTPTPYMASKGVDVHAGVLTDKDGKLTCVPAMDANGKQWSMQYIQQDGTKRFAKDSKKDGCFHVVGGMEQLAAAPALVIAEGYATAATLKQALGFATVAAFDTGNLAQVAEALHAKFPNKPVVIAGDDDRHLAATQGVNPGRTKAEEAARLVNGKAMLPIFAPGENSFPAGVEPVTVEAFRRHRKGLATLSDEQTAALSSMKQFTDFNDLATRSTLGMAGVERQVRAMVDEVVGKHREAALAQQAALANEQGQSHGEQLVEKQKRRRAVQLA